MTTQSLAIVALNMRHSTTAHAGTLASNMYVWGYAEHQLNMSTKVAITKPRCHCRLSLGQAPSTSSLQVSAHTCLAYTSITVLSTNTIIRCLEKAAIGSYQLCQRSIY